MDKTRIQSDTGLCTLAHTKMESRARFNLKFIKVLLIVTLCGVIFAIYLSTTTSKERNVTTNHPRESNAFHLTKTTFSPNFTLGGRHIEPPLLRIPANESFNFELSGMSNATIEKLIEEGSLSNMPKDQIMLSGSGFSASCGKFPTIYDIKYSNTYWQVYFATRWTLYSKAAFLDTRVLNIHKASIRVVGVIEGKKSPDIPPATKFPNITAYCQIWFRGEPEPVVSPVNVYFSWRPEGKNFGFLASILTCNIPESHLSKIPFSVSVVESQCSWSTVNLKVFYDNPRKKKDRFAVCVKPLDFPSEDISFQLIEWIELHYILGVGKIFLPELATTPNTKKVLEYYRKLGKIEIKPKTLPSTLPNQPELLHQYLNLQPSKPLKIQVELVDMQECFFENMYKYDYIAEIDIDEVFVPRRHFDWVDMMNELETKSKTNNTKGQFSFAFKNVYYFYDSNSSDHEHFADIPKENLMLQHVRRIKIFLLRNPYKSFQNTESVVGTYHHSPVSCFGDCEMYNVDEKDALMHHYKPLALCHRTAIPDCRQRSRTKSVLDNTIWRYKDVLIARAAQVATHLQLIP